MSFEQLSLFPDDEIKKTSGQSDNTLIAQTSSISTRMLESFEVSSIPFFGCDFDKLYPLLNEIMPGETVIFPYKNINTIIACETICAAICHQINWDFLRQVVLNKTEDQPNWLEQDSLMKISAFDVNDMLVAYNRPERIRAGERALILQQVGELVKRHGSFKALFLDNGGNLMPFFQIRNNLLECTAFSQDPEEKKLQLLFQKLSNYTFLSGLASFCKPAVDYHLIRCFLRRGLISPVTKRGTEFVFSPEVQRQESTMGALRQLCSDLIKEISNYTCLSINSINQIEWHIGRSICKEGSPDCYLKGIDSKWITEKFDCCPFFSTCCAINYNQRLLGVDEPMYKGTSY